MTNQPRRILCAHADTGGPAHWLAPGETCGRSDQPSDEALVEHMTKAIYDADDHDYSEGAAIGQGQSKPYLENDYARYEDMAKAALDASREIAW